MNGEELTFKVNIEAGETNIGDFIDPSALSSLVQANEEVKQLTDQINALKQAQKEQGQLTVEQAQQLEELNLKLKEARSAYQNQQKDLLNLRNAQTATGKTYNELVARNKALSQIMRELPIDDTTGQLQRLQEEYKANNDALKTFDESMGNHHRNVGNYKDAFEGLGGIFSMLPESMQGASAAFMGMATAIDFADKTTKEADGGFKAFFKTLITNPFGLILIAVTGLIAFLSKLKPVTEALEKVFAVLGATLDTVVGYFEALAAGTDTSTISFKENARAALMALEAQKKYSAMKLTASLNNAKLEESEQKLLEIALDETKTQKERTDAFKAAQLARERMLVDELTLAEQLVFSLANQKDKLQEYNDASAEQVRLGTELRKLRQQQKQDLKDFEAQFIKTNDIIIGGLDKQDKKLKDLFDPSKYLPKEGQTNLVKLMFPSLLSGAPKLLLSLEKERNQFIQKQNEWYIENLIEQGDVEYAIRLKQQQEFLELKMNYLNLGFKEEEAVRMANLESERNANRELNAETRRQREEDRLAQQAKLDNIIRFAQNVTSIGASLFEDNKRIAVAQAIVDTFASAVSAFRGTPGPIWVKASASAAAIAAGLANVKKIVATKPGTGATTSAIPTPAPSAGRVPMVGNAFNPGAPMTMGNANLSAGMAGAMGSRDMGITVNAKVDRKGLAIAVREGEREIKTQQFTFA